MKRGSNVKTEIKTDSDYVCWAKEEGGEIAVKTMALYPNSDVVKSKSYNTRPIGNLDYIPIGFTYPCNSHTKLVGVMKAYIEPLARGRKINGIGCWHSFVRMGVPKEWFERLGQLANNDLKKRGVKAGYGTRWAEHADFMWGTTSVSFKEQGKEMTRFMRVHEGKLVQIEEMWNQVVRRDKSAKGRAVVVLSAIQDKNKKEGFVWQIKLITFLVTGFSEFRGKAISNPAGLEFGADCEFAMTTTNRMTSRMAVTMAMTTRTRMTTTMRTTRTRPPPPS
jgi:hypothetical protein